MGAEVKEKIKDVVNDDLKEWRTNDEKEKTGFREILKQQQQKRRQGIETKVVNVSKNRKTMVRNMADNKKCVMLFCVKEEINPVGDQSASYKGSKI